MLPRHSLFVITGANRGFGSAIAKEISESAKHTTTIVLVGRSYEQLQTVALEVTTRGQPHVTVHSVSDISLENASDAHQTVTEKIQALIRYTITNAVAIAIAIINPTTISQTEISLPVLTNVTLINNAGTLGDLSKTVADYTPQEIQTYININIASYTALVSGFVRLFKQKPHDPQHPTPFPPVISIVNISSLLAIKPFPNWGLYASAKAARDTLLGVVAAEETSVRTLSYAPGPLDNEMQAHVRATLGDQEQKKIYTDMATKGMLVCMKDSARKLLDLLENNEYPSGAHIDFYDPPSTSSQAL
ncbi:hypothetical protein BDF14DRAFT_1741203 [Spinellus fusiger]|nr:hypothetical protein BDF14DRAFT_1741203 [Spinellus fusiger]